MDEIYQCNECNVTFPDKQTATGHRNGTGHTLKIITESDWHDGQPDLSCLSIEESSTKAKYLFKLREAFNIGYDVVLISGVRSYLILFGQMVIELKLVQRYSAQVI